MTGLTDRELRRWAGDLISRVGWFVDDSGWRAGWEALEHDLRGLPADPEPALSALVDAEDLEEMTGLIDALNEERIGVDFARLPSVAGRATNP